jgi:uncharacterized membrane protein YcaP (DUF421 family)
MNSVFAIVLRTGVVYIIVLLGLRLLGKRHVAQLSIIDFVLILLISNAVQNAMVGDDSSLWGGIIAAATLLILNYLITSIMIRSRKADILLEGTPTLLIHNGQLIHEHLLKEHLSTDELERAIREHGFESVVQVKIAVMELDGTISVISRNAEERTIETFKRRRSKFTRATN